jgi:hypothetical protein
MSWLNQPFSEHDRIGVSIEPEGGSVQPSQVVLLGGG